MDLNRLAKIWLVGICVLLPYGVLAQTYHSSEGGTVGCKDPAAAFLLFSSRQAKEDDPVTYRQVYDLGKCSNTASNVDWLLEKSYQHTALMHLNGGTIRLYFPLEAMISAAGKLPPAGSTDDGPDLP